MIKLYEGNILESDADFICHQVNCMGVMGAGLAKQIKRKWPEVYKKYYELCQGYERKALLGNYLIVNTGSKAKDGHLISVVNLFCQYGYGKGCQTNYNALEKAIKRFFSSLKQVKENLRDTSISTIAIPYKLGCGLAGGDWNVVYDIIQRNDVDWADIQIWKLPIEAPSFEKEYECIWK